MDLYVVRPAAAPRRPPPRRPGDSLHLAGGARGPLAAAPHRRRRARRELPRDRGPARRARSCARRAGSRTRAACPGPREGRMSAPAFETFLARLYTDPGTRRDFLDDPVGAAARAGLEPAEIDAIAAIDRVGLELAAVSSERKRAARAPRRTSWKRRLVALAQSLKP